MIFKSGVVSLCFVTAIVGISAQAPAPATSDQFYNAIRSGDITQLTSLIQNGNDVNAKERRGGATPLMHAAAIGTVDAMRLLLDNGADLNARSAGGATALMWAVTDLAKVRLLVDRGVDVNVSSNLGHTALELAAMSDESGEIVRLLLTHGADPKAVDKGKLSTLGAATIGNDTATIRQLVDAGVDVNAADMGGFTPLITAAQNGNLEAVKLLLAKGAFVNAVSAPPGGPALTVKNGIIQLGQFTPLLAASTFGPAELVKALIAAGANVNVKEARGMTPLMLSVAADHGDLNVTRALLAAGADPNAKSLAGETALNWAQKSGATPGVVELKRVSAMATPMAAHQVPDPAPTTARLAVTKGMDLLERTTGTFFVNSACGACHAQNVTDFAVMSARKHGIAINDAAAAQRASGAAAVFGSTASGLLERVDGPAIDIQLYTLGGFAAGGYPADRATDALVVNVSAQQWHDGRWHIGGLSRPPIEDGDFSRTALGVRALKVYGLPGRRAEMTDRISRALAWLQSNKPLTTEDRSFRLMGLAWGGVNADAVRRAATDLVAAQRADGGWSQRDEMTSDAYATGLAMYALRESGALAATADPIQKGAKYLLSTQRSDGSWYVRSRSPKFQPYFEGGFPYGHDQWISSMATGWATAALAAAQEAPAAANP
jgi:ankyrin repeat protein